MSKGFPTSKLADKYGAETVLHDLRRSRWRGNRLDFLRECIKTIDRSGKGLVPLDPFKQQMMVLESIAQQERDGMPVRTITLKPRQTGLSTLIQSVLFHGVLFHDATSALTLAHDKYATAHIFRFPQVFYHNLPEWLKPGLRAANANEMVFGTAAPRGRPHKGESRLLSHPVGSQLKVQTAGNRGAGASQTLQYLHLSEAGRYTNCEALLSSLFPTVPFAPGTHIHIESTGEEANRWFYSMWQRAVSGNSNYAPIFFPWFTHPDYCAPESPLHESELDPYERELLAKGATLANLAWRRIQLRDMDERTFRSQYPADPSEAFILSGSLVFSEQLLLRIQEQIEQPRFEGAIVPGTMPVEEPGGPLWIWNYPESGKQYDLAVDVSMGVEDGDFSAIQVLERGTYRQVAEFMDRVDPLALAPMVESLGRFYNTAQIGVELNGPGYFVHNEIQRSYPYIYRWRYRDRQSAVLSPRTGWVTGRESKEYAVSMASTCMSNYGRVVRSRRLWEQLSTFVKRGGGMEAAYNCYDDLVMAYCIACVISDDENYGRHGFATEPEPELARTQDCDKWNVDEYEPGVRQADSWLEL